MRRGFSILLMLVLGLGPLSSLIDGSEDVNLPACCRRHGAHHCAMEAQIAAMMRDAQSGKAPIVSAPMTCPYYPGAVNALWTPALAAAAAEVQALASSSLALAAMQTLAHRSPAETHAGRGPPALSLS